MKLAMTFQALLFCQDEKTARVTTQVLNDLEFSVETCNEPFVAVKKLMGQHFDAIVVDCTNEQNATLLFKSARNSSSNQASLAVAVVEGQSGVASAFRIGANLVLTKPINVEQAKGTLRVARGLLKKSGETLKPTPPIEAAPTVQSWPSQPVPAAGAEDARLAAPPQPPKAAPLPVQKSAVAPAARNLSTDAADLFDVEPESSPASEPAELLLDSLDEHPAAAKKPAELPAPAAATPPTLASRPADIRPGFANPVVSGSGAASAPAPAKTTSKPPAAIEPPARRDKRADILLPMSAAPAEQAFGTHVDRHSAPTFGQPESSEKPEGSGAGKFAIVAILLAALASGAYFGYSKLHRQAPAPEVEVQQQPEPAPVTPTEPSPSPTLSQKPSATVQSVPSASSTSTAHKTNADTVSEAEPEVTVTKLGPAPTIVKSGPRSAPKSQEAEVQAPSVLGTSSANESTLSNIVSSAPVSVPVPAPPPTEMLKVSQGVTQGMVTKRVQPIYPHQAMQMHISGSVQLLAVISKTGSISSVKVVSGDPILARAAAEAVKQWKYKPYTLNNEPVDIQTQVTVNFRLP